MLQKEAINIMQGYETIFILRADTPQDQQEALLDKYKKLVEGQGGKVVHQNTWGRRKLAYEVKKEQFGIYHLFYLDHAPQALRTLENTFRIEDSVLKWFSVSVEDIEAENAAFDKLKSEGTIAEALTE